MNQEQEELYKLLDLFANFCADNHLRYFLVGGTLIGAVRHHGFIPWDDDIDVAMLEEDYNKLIQLKDQFPHWIVLQSKETDERYPFLFAKICNKNIPFATNMSYGPRGIYIDVFPLICSGMPNRKNRIMYNLILIIDYVLQVKCKWCSYIPYKNKLALLTYSILSLFSENSLKGIRYWLVKQIHSVKEEGTLCSIGGAYKAEKEFYPKEWFTDTEEMLFEKKYYTVPVGWHNYLSRNYGNYMKLPPLHERHTQHKG